jgi:hypothetical protein
LCHFSLDFAGVVAYYVPSGTCHYTTRKDKRKVLKLKRKTATLKRKTATAVVIATPTPSLGETCDQLEATYLGVMAGTIPLDRARVGLATKKQQMKRFDWAIQAARMLPAWRPNMAAMLGLPEPKGSGGDSQT